MQQDNRHVPDWLLERLALGELDAETAADVRRRLAAEGRSPDEIDRGRRGVEPGDPRGAARDGDGGGDPAARREGRGGPPGPAGARSCWPLPLALAGGVAASLLLTGADPNDDRRRSRVEGRDAQRSTSIATARRAIERLTDGAHAARGDLLQLAYASRRRLRRAALDRRRAAR